MSDKEYRTTFVESLPGKMSESRFAPALLRASRVLQLVTSIDPDILIDHIAEEAERLAAARHKWNGSLSGKWMTGGRDHERTVVERHCAFQWSRFPPTLFIHIHACANKMRTTLSRVDYPVATLKVSDNNDVRRL